MLGVSDLDGVADIIERIGLTASLYVGVLILLWRAGKAVWPLVERAFNATIKHIETSTETIQKQTGILEEHRDALAEQTATLAEQRIDTKNTRKAATLAIDEVYRALPEEKRREIRQTFDEAKRLLQ